jgi:hypothetical protein
VTGIRALVVCLVATAAVQAQHAPPSDAAPTPCPRCAWTAPSTARTVRVATVPQLEAAVRAAQPGTTILIGDGQYRLDAMLHIAVPHVVLRGAGGDAARVVLRGDGMAERRVGVAISVGAPDVVIADLTVGFVGYHGIQVRGESGASRVVLHNVHVLDTGQQLVKGSVSSGPDHADDGLVACSLFEYTDHAPSDYTNGVDILAGRGWTVRDNRFERIRGPASGRWAAGPAVLFWANSQDTVVERNVIVDSFRGIALGLGPGASDLARNGERVLDHQGGRIRNNVIVNLHAWADEGIEANSAAGVSIEHNTVLTEGRVDWSISLRFPATAAAVRNNLTSRPIVLRNGGRARLEGNVQEAGLNWFVDAAAGDFRLNPARDEQLRAGAFELGPAAAGAAR